mgnify:CR=1 FL=1
MPYIYVLGMDGKPQMPTTRRRHVQKLLDTGKARIAEHVPLTIQLLYDNDPVLQPVTLAEDPGRTNIGLAILDLKGNLLLSAVVETRNKEIAKLMEKRRQCRRASRNGERKARQRLAKKYGTMIKAGMMMRKLPQYAAEKFITCKIIRNTESRFCNRKRKDGWLTPSARHLVQTHVNLVHKIQKYLPVTDVALEVNRFAFMLLEDPSVCGVDFQNGPLKGYDDRDAVVYDLQDGKCLMCKNEITQYHHIVPRSRNGSNTINNIAGLCDKCHDRVHKDADFAKQLKDKKAGLDKKYGALSVLNQAIPFICKELETEFGKEHVHYCTGRETSLVRRSLGYHKTKEEQYHEVDAWCIGALSLDSIPEKAPAFEEVHTIMQFRRQDRALIKAQTSRSYKLDGETVAWNRKKRTDQKNDSLEDWYQKQVQLHGQKEAGRMRSRLTVKISQRRYNNPERMLPGAVFLYKGKRYVMKGQHCNGVYLQAVGMGSRDFPVKECTIIKRNQGLVFLS